jgi:hypothetical protein
MENLVAHRETYIETGDGGAAGIVAGLLIVALVIVGFFFFFSVNNSGRQTIDIDVPAVSVTPDGQ